MQWVLVLVLGWLSGVLVNALADALPHVRRPGYCPVCGAPLSTPAALGVGKFYGKCNHPRGRRSLWLPFLGAVGAVGLWFYPTRLGFWASWPILVYFALIIVIDLEHHLILHVESAVGALLALGIGVWRHGLVLTLVGGGVGWIVMWLLYRLGEWFALWVARRRGEVLEDGALGFGDVNLSGVIGLMLGWPGVVAGLVLAILLGGIFSGGYVLWMLVRRRYQAFTAIPYGPFLALATLWLLLWAG